MRSIEYRLLLRGKAELPCDNSMAPERAAIFHNINDFLLHLHPIWFVLAEIRDLPSMFSPSDSINPKKTTQFPFRIQLTRTQPDYSFKNGS